MIARVADRGTSFVGAGKYYLHDKEASTSERVAWTYIHNIATDDPEKAMRYMAYTAMHSDYLKHEAGVSNCGRKATAGAVYSFSLSWSPEEAPLPDYMKQAGLDTLVYLGLIEHEAVMVAHQDTDHPHVHVIANLVHPENGKTVVPAYDYLTLSTWAEAYEKEHGKIYCEQRVINNELRREQARDGRQLGLVKHRESKHAKSELIRQLYEQSDNGKAFRAALNEQGFTLARGDRRGFVLVDDRGQISSLSRQIKGQRAADIRARLQDIVQEELPAASDLSAERQYHRNHPPLEKETPDMPRDVPEQKPAPDRGKSPKDTGIDEALSRNRHFLSFLDREREAEAKQDTQSQHLESRQQAFYQRQETLDQLKAIAKQIQAQSNMAGRFSGRLQRLLEKQENLQKNLDNIDQRIHEQRQALERQFREDKSREQGASQPPPEKGLDNGLEL